MNRKFSATLAVFALLAASSTAYPAVAGIYDGTAQLFKCNSTSNVTFRQSTSKDTQFDYGRTNKVADVATNSSGGTCGVEYRFDGLLFDDQDVIWFYSLPRNSAAFNNLTVKYIFKTTGGGQKIEYTIKAGTDATVKPVHNNWNYLTQKNSSFPSNVRNTQAFLQRVQFIFDNKVSSTITLGDLRLQSRSSSSSSATISDLDLELKGCP
ncbi:MAG: hypothetical protein U0103_06830 [Candidatus Obscuribacterales bacterium]